MFPEWFKDSLKKKDGGLPHEMQRSSPCLGIGPKTKIAGPRPSLHYRDFDETALG